MAVNESVHPKRGHGTLRVQRETTIQPGQRERMRLEHDHEVQHENGWHHEREVKLSHGTQIHR